MAEEIQLLQSEELLSARVFNVVRDRFTRAGKTHAVEMVEHVQSYAILARPQPDQILLIREYRHPAGSVLWEIPAGNADPDESPEEGALRELREETGYRAGRIREIYGGYLTPGYCTEFMRFFLAEELQPGPTQFDEDEDIETVVMPIQRALAMLRSGEILDAKTALGLLLLYHLKGEQMT